MSAAIYRETKFYNFANGLIPNLKQAPMLRQTLDYNTAVFYARLKDNMSPNNYDWLLEQIKYLTYTNKQQELPVDNLNYPDPVKLTQENGKLKTRTKQLKRGKKNSNTVLFPSYIRKLRNNEFVTGLRRWVI